MKSKIRNLKLPLFLVLLFLPQVTVAQNPERLAGVRKIYLGDLGKGENVDLIREKLRLRLMKSGRFSVVETADDADALLIGVTEVSSATAGSISTNPTTGQVSGSAGTVYEGAAIVRLVDPTTKATIWIYEYERGFFRPRSASSDIAGKIVSRLTKDAKNAEKTSRPPTK